MRLQCVEFSTSFYEDLLRAKDGAYAAASPAHSILKRPRTGDDTSWSDCDEGEAQDGKRARVSWSREGYSLRARPSAIDYAMSEGEEDLPAESSKVADAVSSARRGCH